MIILLQKAKNLLFRSARPGTSSNGFTLLELLVVSTLIAIMLAVSVPAFRTTLFTDQLRQAARKVIGTIHEVRQAATGSRNGCYIDLDISDNQLSYNCPDPVDQEGDDQEAEDKPESVTKLPSPVSISSVWLGADRNVTSGNTSVWVNQKGLMDQLIINLTDGEKDLALVSSVFVSTIRLEDKTMSPDDLEEN